MDIMRPFGPTITRTYLDDDIYDKFITITDDLLLDPNRVDVGDRLAGKIKEQIDIPLHTLVEYELKDFILDSVNFYLDTVFESLANDPPKRKLELITCWFNSMYKNEWNPIHVHSTDVSAVIVLKVPEGLKEGEGTVSFTNGSYRIVPELEHSTQIFLPREKHFYLFPARLHHSVNPFTCEGERRTLSFNINCNFTM
tara:strand:- start:155 stop:745 length:591 start_codon:yes stop_codon:yes gene_type:complete